MTEEEHKERDNWRVRAWNAEAKLEIATYDINLLLAMAKPRGLKDDPQFMRIENWHATKERPAATLRWHEGPSRGGEGTAGKDRWYDGDTLFVIVEQRVGFAMYLVRVRADGDLLAFEDSEGNDIGWGSADISWYANLEHALPNGITD